MGKADIFSRQSGGDVLKVKTGGALFFGARGGNPPVTRTVAVEPDRAYLIVSGTYVQTDSGIVVTHDVYVLQDGEIALIATGEGPTVTVAADKRSITVTAGWRTGIVSVIQLT